MRSVAVGVWLKRGSRHERPDQTGISHFIEHMVFKGTKTRSAERIAEELARGDGDELQDADALRRLLDPEGSES